MKQIFILLFFAIICCLGVCAQEEPDEVDPCVQELSRNTQQKIKKARDLQNSGKRKEAFAIYDALLSENPNLLDVNYYIGLSYYLQIQRDNYRMDIHKKDAAAALEAFNRIYEVCPYHKPAHNLYAARIAYFSEDFANAMKFAKVIVENPDIFPKPEDIEEANIIINKSKFYNEILNNPVPFDPKIVPGICTEADEYLATISPDGQQFYFTRRVQEMRNQGFGEELTDVEYFSVSESGKTGDFGRGTPLPYPFNESYKEGSPAINLTNDLLIFSRLLKGNIGGKPYPNYDLFYSEFIDGSWTDPENFGAKINRGDSWESNPSLSSDGKLLLFASDRPGGYGGSDIWFSVRNSDGTWREAQNMGPVINTAGNERSPFLHTDSKTLYFSSNGHDKIGGMDIFYSRMDENNVWTKPKNIGYPINSENDEIDFFVSFDGKTAYYSSNNITGKDWNIYQFELYEKARPKNMMMIKGKVAIDDESDDLSEIVVEIRDTTSQVVAKTTVNQNSGKYALVTEVDAYNPQPMIVNVKKEGYVFDTHLVMPDLQEQKIVENHAEIKRVEANKTYNLHDIHFGTNLYLLTAESKQIINLFVEFLQENPTIVVEIQGHTDNIGDAHDNQLLSERRAKSVYDYVLSKHVDASRVSYKGYGASKPVASNETEEGRAKNRRTVFVIKEL